MGVARCTQHYCWCTQHFIWMGKNAPGLNLKTKNAPIHFFFYAATLLHASSSPAFGAIDDQHSCYSTIEVSLFFLHAFALLVLFIYGCRVKNLGFSSYGCTSFVLGFSSYECTSSVFCIESITFIQMKFIRMIDTNELHSYESYGCTSSIWLYICMKILIFFGQFFFLQIVL